MNRKFLGIGVCLVALVALAGCEKTKQVLGQTKKSPDEFAVYSRAPLSTPPEYQLRPPTPGAERPQAVNPRDRARQAILSNSRGVNRGGPAPQAAPAGASSGEVAVLRATGALNADPTIRARVNQEASVLAEEADALTERLVFWRDPPPAGTAVDPAKEAKRLREAQALGKPLNEGEVPVIERKQRAIFEGVFN